MIPEYEVLAVRYATAERQARTNFLLPRPGDAVMPIDYFFWVIRRGKTVVVVDTGFSVESGRARNRVHACPPAEALSALRVAPDEVGHVVLTHLHYDHAGNIGLFGRATIHLQRAELEYTTGPSMRHAALSHFFELDDVKRVVGEVYRGRVQVHDGDAELLPGVSVHLIGGHTEGLQVVRVRTARGWIVLAADAAHYAANLRERNPFPALTNLPRVLDGYERLLALADGPDHVIPGHDPAVMRLYRRHPAERVSIALLHEPPTTEPGGDDGEQDATASAPSGEVRP